MLPKKNRVEKKKVDEVFKNGLFLASSNLSLKFLLSNDENEPKVSFVTPKSLIKLAVKRNALRRLGYTAIRKHLSNLPQGFVGVFVFKKIETNLSLLENEIEKILHKIH